MMKRVCLSLSILSLALIFTSPKVAAQNLDKEKIDDLKERVATRVAQLRIPIYKVLIGQITAVDKDSLTLKTSREEKKILTTTETNIYRVARGRKTTATLSNLKAQERAAVVGSQDSQGEFIAKTIYVKALPVNTNGEVEKTDVKNYTITVKNAKNNTSYLVDIETTTKIQTWKKEEGFKNSGFSKLQVGSRVHVNGLPVAGEENRLSAVRILVLPEFGPGATGTPSTTPSAQEITPTATP